MIDLARVRADADIFIDAIDDSFWEEYGISSDDAVRGLITLYRETGRINYAQEKSIREEIAAEQRAERERLEAARKASEANETPSQRNIRVLLAGTMQLSTQYMKQQFYKNVLGFDPYEAHERRVTEIRAWWRANGVTL